MASYFQFLDNESTARHIWQYKPSRYKHLSLFLQELMRGPSALSPGERELIGAFVSGLNACQYCFGSHRATAGEFGIDTKKLEALLDDINTAPVADKLKPIFRFVQKLNNEPSKITEADAEAVFEAGWNEDALHDVIALCAWFNFSNRMLDGHGVKGNADLFKSRSKDLAEKGYAVANWDDVQESES